MSKVIRDPYKRAIADYCLTNTDMSKINQLSSSPENLIASIIALYKKLNAIEKEEENEEL